MGCCEKHCPGGSGGPGLAVGIGAGVLALAVAAPVARAAVDVLHVVAVILTVAAITAGSLAALTVAAVVTVRLRRARSLTRAGTGEPYRVTVLPPEPARLYGPQSIRPGRRAALPGRSLRAPQRPGERRALPVWRVR